MMLAALALSAAPSCSLPPGWSAVAARQTPYIVLGESHGTEAGPATLAQIACALAARGERVLVAVEQNATDDAALHAAWVLTETSDFAIAAPRVLHWQGRSDGNGSRATLAMLTRLHRLKSGGRSIDIVAFNGARDDDQRARFKDLPGQGPHEAAQADNIRQVALARNYDHVLVLVGNLHARKRPVTSGGVTFEPMAMRLAPASQVTSLLLTFSRGTMWNCIAKPGVTFESGKPIGDDIDCGAHATGGLPPAGATRGVRMGPPPGSKPDDGYDGALYTGSAVGSPPVLPGKP